MGKERKMRMGEDEAGVRPIKGGVRELANPRYVDARVIGERMIAMNDQDGGRKQRDPQERALAQCDGSDRGYRPVGDELGGRQCVCLYKSAAIKR
jgi:hypothetical protein